VGPRASLAAVCFYCKK